MSSRVGTVTAAVGKLIIQNPTEPLGQLAKMQLGNNFTATKDLISQIRREMVSEGLVSRIPKKPLSFTPEQQRIYTENLPEITRQLNRVARSLPSFLQEDFIAHSQEIIIRVIQNFDPNKGKLKIYITRSLTENRKRFLSNLTRNISGIPHNRINSALKTDKLAQKKIAGGMRKDTAYREAAEEVLVSTKSTPRNVTPEYILEDLRAINTARSQIPYHELQEEKAGSLPEGKKRTPRKLR